MMDWNDETERMMIEYAEKAQCYKYLHSRVKKDVFDTLTIAASGINGCLNFAILLIASTYLKEILLVTAGAVNLLLLVVTSYQKVRKGTDTDMEHRLSAIAWGKLYSTIRMQLALAPDNRMECGRAVDRANYEYTRLLECAPSIPNKVIEEFRDHFGASLPVASTNIEVVD